MEIGKISPGEGNDNPTPVFFAWRIPWSQEPGGQRSVGSQSRHDLAAEHINQLWERGGWGGCQSRKWFSWEQTGGGGQ